MAPFIDGPNPFVLAKWLVGRNDNDPLKTGGSVRSGAWSNAERTGMYWRNGVFRFG